MLAFTPDQWLILLLAFVLGLILGMALLASPKWKRRYRDEVAPARGARGRERAAPPRRPRDGFAAPGRRQDEARHDAGADDRPRAALISRFLQRRLRRRQAGDRHAVGRGADVIEADRLAEGDAGRVAAMLAANAELEAGPGRPAPLGGDRDQLADALDVEADERDRAAKMPFST